ncbi:hypothetical protein F2Q69_00023505 [Brassica cretica]|uniref:Uncharacterized protein n=1 Tax=Brassica cretica TaxID=69181 RepID=A0A8S9QF57_BRACR|nr:hypothetical protein F2Q69_00023505 [Brassica cretica]
MLTPIKVKSTGYSLFNRCHKSTAQDLTRYNNDFFIVRLGLIPGINAHHYSSHRLILINNLYDNCKVPRTVKIDLVSGNETLENLRGVLRVLNYIFRGSRASKEGLVLGIEELCQLCLIKWNNRALGTFLISIWPGRQIVEGISYLLSGSLPMSDDLREIIKSLCQDRPHWLSFDYDRLRAVRMSRRATLRTAGSTRGKEVMVDSSLVTILDSQAKKGTVVSPVPIVGDTEARDPAKWRPRGCHLPALSAMTEKDAYVKMVIANAKDHPRREEVEARKATIKQLRQELESVQTERKKRSRELKVAKDELKRANLSVRPLGLHVYYSRKARRGSEGFRGGGGQCGLPPSRGGCKNWFIGRNQGRRTEAEDEIGRLKEMEMGCRAILELAAVRDLWRRWNELIRILKKLSFLMLIGTRSLTFLRVSPVTLSIFHSRSSLAAESKRHTTADLLSCGRDVARLVIGFGDCSISPKDHVYSFLDTEGGELGDSFSYPASLVRGGF